MSDLKDFLQNRLIEIATNAEDDRLLGDAPDTDTTRTHELFHLLKHYPGKEAEALALIDRGVDTNAVEEKTPLLFHAAKNNSLAVVRALVEKGADIHQRIGHTSLLAYLERDSALYYYIENITYPPTQCWTAYGENAVAEVQTNPALNQKLTHVFNFTTHEKMTIVQNTYSNAISISPISDFNEVAPQRLQQAAAEYKKINPDFDDNSVKGFGKSRLDFTAG